MPQTSEITEKDWTFENLIHKDKIWHLKKVLDEYPDIVRRDSEGEDENGNTIYPKDLIMKTYIFEKPLTSIEIHGMNFDRVLEFIDLMKDFFFVTHTSMEINVSRFRTLSDIAIGKLGEGENIVRLSDNHADLAGNFYGYSPRKVLDYCIKEGKYNLIKY